jgi:hypothetical protein
MAVSSCKENGWLGKGGGEYTKANPEISKEKLAKEIFQDRILPSRVA